MFALKLLAICLTLFLVEAKAAEKSARLLYGQNANSQMKFPHHVIIGKCGGSIIHPNWILTTKTCLAQNENIIELKFQRFYLGVNVFSLTINNDAKIITKHPFNDIALIKLPVNLQFDENLKAIELYESGKVSFDSGSIGVVPGFDDNSNNHSELKYGLFQFEAFLNGDCKKNNLIDEYSQICTASYNGYPGNPLCDNDVGSGLVIGWNEHPLLLGVLTQGTCTTDYGNEIYTKVESFVPWIETVTKANFSFKTTTWNWVSQTATPKPTTKSPIPQPTASPRRAPPVRSMN